MNEPALPARGPAVFVSYSFANPQIEELQLVLKTRGFRVTVVDDRTLLGQPSLYDALAGLISEADYVVPLVDEAAKASSWVAQELELAILHGVPIIPLLHEGVEPDGLLADIPSVLGLDTEGIVRRILQNYGCLNFDPAYPAHLRAEPLIEYMRGEKPALVDMDLALSASLLEVVQGLLRHNHQGLGAQTLRQWRRVQETLDKLQQVSGSYRATLHAMGWVGNDARVTDSWNALTRMVVGRDVLRLAETCVPGEDAGWQNLNEGVARMCAEWEIVEGEDDLTRHLLWALGKRDLPLGRWSEDRESPLGNWVRVTAALYTGQRIMMIVPDTKVTRSGLRLKEPAHLYLEIWDWGDFLLPQLVYRGVELRPDLGKRMLVSLEED